jgi:hypothetical protein
MASLRDEMEGLVVSDAVIFTAATRLIKVVPHRRIKIY